MNDPISLDELRTAASRGGRAIDGGAAFSVIRDNHLLALVEAVEAAQRFERMASYDFYPDARVQARLDLRAALARFALPRAQEGDET